MIFVSLGSQQYQFDRLLQELDSLIERGKLKDEVFAQSGHSTYVPKYYKSHNFLSQEEYETNVRKADLVITHAGTGAIIKALKADKQVIVVPRQAKFGEHADDHQFQIADFMEENGYVFKVVEMCDLMPVIEEAAKHPKEKRFALTGNILGIIEDYICTAIGKK